MTDENEKPIIANVTPLVSEAQATETPTVMGLPLASFMRGGGTSTYASDMQLERYKEDAARRRGVADAERRAASRPIEEGGAQLHTNKLTESPDAEVAHVLLVYLTPGGEVRYQNGDEFKCLADIVMVGEKELSLILVCPTCMDRNLPMDLCQLQIRQSNRKWELDLDKAGELIMFDGHPYRSAGEIMECERFTCPTCRWSARIDKNRVRPV